MKLYLTFTLARQGMTKEKTSRQSLKEKSTGIYRPEFPNI